MPRNLKDIIANIRACIADGSISTAIIQTEDVTVLCDAAGDVLQRLDQLEAAVRSTGGGRTRT